MKRRAAVALATLFVSSLAHAEAPPPFAPGATSLTSAPALATTGVTTAQLDGPRFSFSSYLQKVGQGNLDLAAQRATVSVAEAQIAVARIFPDPLVTAGLLQYDVTGHDNPTATILALNVPLQIGGQRGARVALAESNLSATQADLDDFFRSLRAAAAHGYVDALHARLVLERRRRTLESLTKLVTVNEERLKAGDIGEAALSQSRVEASQFRADVFDAEGGVRTADLALVELLGTNARGAMGHALALDGDLRNGSDRTFDVPALVRKAIAQRPDLLAAKRRLVSASKQVDLAHANRTIDVGLGATWQHNFPVGAATPSIPSSDFLGGTVTVPLPFSRLYRGELDAAYATQKQAEALTGSANVKVEVEVREAVARYEAAAARVKLYTGGVLNDADQVLEKMFYNYQRGGATLVEVLVAQRTDNDVYLSYYDALADAAHALVAVEQASASWDVSF